MSRTAITLVCNPETGALSEELVDDVAHALLDAFGEVRRRTLSDEIAEDFDVEGAHAPADIRSILAPALDAAPVDLFVQPARLRRKRLLIADMDSTIIGQECIDELADFAGRKAEISAITDRAMRGELDFEAALRARVGMLKGLSARALEACFEERIRLNPGARTLVATMRAHGAVCALVSGGFTFFVERIARLAGFDEYRANTLLFDGGALSGDVAEPILGRAAKAETLAALAGARGLDLSETTALGDGANDIDMIALSGFGVAYRAKPALIAAADAAIDHADLTALLFAQGYTADEFAG